MAPHSGILVPSTPMSFQIRYIGTIVTAPGSIIVPSTSPNRVFRREAEVREAERHQRTGDGDQPGGEEGDVDAVATTSEQRQLLPDFGVVVRGEVLRDERVVEHLGPRLERGGEQPDERVQEASAKAMSTTQSMILAGDRARFVPATSELRGDGSSVSGAATRRRRAARH